MKARLTFVIPEEEDDFRVALDGHKYRRVLKGVDAHLRALLKHGDLSDSDRKTLEAVRDTLYSRLLDEGVDILD